MTSRPNLKDLRPEALREQFRKDGIKPFHADQVVAWLYARCVDDPAEMTDLPADLRTTLASDWQTRALDLVAVQKSTDGTRKLALRAVDGAVVAIKATLQWPVVFLQFAFVSLERGDVPLPRCIVAIPCAAQHLCDRDAAVVEVASVAGPTLLAVDHPADACLVCIEAG